MMKRKPATSKPKVAACVIVRMKSTRLPRKALLDICGKPVTLHLIDRLRQAEMIDEIVLCTSTHPDDRVLLERAEDWGVESIAGAEDDVLARIEQVAAQYGADLLLRVTGDNPLIDPATIDRMVRKHIEADAEYTRTSGLPLGATVEVLSASMLPRLREAIPDPTNSEYMLLYAFDPERFDCQILDAPPEIKRPYYNLAIDTPDDLVFLRTLYTALEPLGGDAAPMEDVIRILDEMEYKGIPRSTPIKMPDGETISYVEFLGVLEERALRARAQD